MTLVLMEKSMQGGDLMKITPKRNIIKNLFHKQYLEGKNDFR